MSRGRETAVFGLVAVMLLAGCAGGPECRVDTDCPGTLFCLDSVCQSLPDGGGDPCDGVVCDQPPPDGCQDPATLLWYQTPGTCSQGECSYTVREVHCEDGCLAGECRGCQPDCEGLVCGPDGCGGSCAPGCEGGDVCDDGFCHSQEICNGFDDDADGLCDDGFACCLGDTAPCMTSCGTQGVKTCIQGCSWRCDPPAESCNGIDDDCNGQTDELENCSPCGTMLPFDTLPRGSTLESCNGRAKLIHQGDGNLVFVMNTGALLWNTQTWDQPSDHLAMQGDGNLVLVSTSNQALWYSGTWDFPGAYLAVQNDCNLVIYSGSQPIWTTGTQCL